MVKKIILILNLSLLLGVTPHTIASTTINYPLSFFVQKDLSGYESNASNSRSGTENWEEPQSSFFVLPGVVLGVIAVLLFFNRNE